MRLLTTFLNMTVRRKEFAALQAYKFAEESRSKMSFLEAVADKYSPEDAAKVKEILERMQTVSPSAGEFFRGAESLYIIRRDCGVVLRVGDPLKTPEHDLVLQPWKKCVLRKAVFEVLPVLPGPEQGCYPENDGRAADLIETFSILHRDGLEPHDLYDGHAGIVVAKNFVYLPAQAAPFKGCVPVVCDRGAVGGWNHRSSPLGISAPFKDAAYNGLQQRLFSRFTALLNRAWPEGADLPAGGGAMAEFWETCRAEVGKHMRGEPALLGTGAGEPDASFKSAGDRYHMRLYSLQL